jgi:hypothetical protein
MITNNENPIGKNVLREILDKPYKAFEDVQRFDFEPYEGIYRLGDCCWYVSESEFETYWEQFPEWHRKAWMLADNGQYDFDDVAGMTIPEIIEAYDDQDFCPEYAFYTTANEDGTC